MELWRTTMPSLLILITSSALFHLGSVADKVKAVKGHSRVGYRYFTEYYEGSTDSRLIIVIPHGGRFEPSDLPIRDSGCYDAPTGLCLWSHNCGDKDTEHCNVTGSKDEMTWELGWKVRQQIKNIAGYLPYIVVNHLHPKYLDPDTNIDLGTFGEVAARRAWVDFHHFITDARSHVAAKGPGLLVDLHSHAHLTGDPPVSQGHASPQDWIELGYLVSARQLNRGELDPLKSSIRSLTYRTDATQFETILRGNKSLGALLQQQGYDVMPSPDLPSPANQSYQHTGYIVKEYGSLSRGWVDAVRITLPEEVDDRMRRYSSSLTTALVQFMEENYGIAEEDSNLGPSGFHGSSAAVMCDRWRLAIHITVLYLWTRLVI